MDGLIPNPVKVMIRLNKMKERKVFIKARINDFRLCNLHNILNRASLQFYLIPLTPFSQERKGIPLSAPITKFFETTTI